MRPPLPSPFGDFENSAGGDDDAFLPQISLGFRLKVADVPRRIFKELLVVPLTVGIVLLEVTILTAILHPVFRAPLLSFLELWVVSLCVFLLLGACLATPIALFETRQKKRVILTSFGVIRCQGNQRVEMPWSALFAILNWSGDVILVTFATGIFLPRELFDSSAQAREFVEIARELRKTRGAAWRDEWNGKTFGSDA